MATFTNIAGAEPSTVTFRVASVQIARGSTNEQQEILVIGDPESSVSIARVSSGAPASSDAGVVVRQVGYTAPSTTVNVSSLAGTVAVAQASTVWAVQVAGYSTTAQVSSVGGVVAVTPNSTTWQVQVEGYSTTAQVSSVGGTVSVAQASTTFAVQLSQYSTTAQVSSVGGVVSVAQNSTTWAVQLSQYSTTVNVSSLGGLVSVGPQSTSAPSSGSSGLVVRWPDVNSTQYAQSTAFNNSTAITLQSSAASARCYVHCYAITSTIATAQVGGFYSSNNLIWPFVLQAVSSGISGIVQQVPQPGYLFKSNANEALSIRIPGATNAGMNVGVSWYVSA